MGVLPIVLPIKQDSLCVFEDMGRRKPFILHLFHPSSCFSDMNTQSQMQYEQSQVLVCLSGL